MGGPLHRLHMQSQRLGLQFASQPNLQRIIRPTVARRNGSCHDRSAVAGVKAGLHPAAALFQQGAHQLQQGGIALLA
ncbi:hypothetical protein D3C71_1668590 [compost metagenome]